MLLGRLARDTRGSVALVFGVLLIVLIVGVGVAVDFARGAQVRTQLQNVVDAAALAGVGVYTDRRPRALRRRSPRAMSPRAPPPCRRARS